MVISILIYRKINPILPIPSGPSFDNNMHGPSIKKLAIPLAADNKEDIKEAMYKKSTSLGSNDIVPVCSFP